MRLFIIGNGFDMAHGLPTSYNHFRKYLEETYQLDLENMPYIPKPEIDVSGKKVWNDSQVATLLVYLISCAEGNYEKWSDVENAVGRLDYTEFFELLPHSNELEKYIDENENLSEMLEEMVGRIQVFFSNWINSIDRTEVQKIKEFSDLIQMTDVFLNFNYTETLEDVYGISPTQICHLHGKRNEEIVFGHCNVRDYAVEYAKYNGSQAALNYLEYSLKKETDMVINRNQSFFESLEDVTEVYVIGFSFGKVDEPYLDEICYRISNDAIWFFNEYSRHDVPKYIKILRRHASDIKYDIIQMT